ncbi:MAG: SOS response-associated peptidase [Chloroflexi bacterium]|nr:SOS response-associated peptidase [Chloroflexota bacterium]MCL5275211.1 SOS response-associated peptidase [Chloroflexota bacterium]
MCGRFTVTVDPEELMERFHLQAADEMPAPRYNVAPTQNVPVVLNESPTRLSTVQWGLIPPWAKDPAIGAQMINARAETVPEKPAFRAAFKKRRCLVLADGFYEWRKEDDVKTKTPMLVRLKSGEPFAMAGLWELWTSPDGRTRRTCTIITTNPNELVAPIHNRMPVILPRYMESDWLDDSIGPLALAALLRPYPADEMQAFAVSRRVNAPANDDSDLVQPV